MPNLPTPTELREKIAPILSRLTKENRRATPSEMQELKAATENPDLKVEIHYNDPERTTWFYKRGRDAEKVISLRIWLPAPAVTTPKPKASTNEGATGETPKPKRKRSKPTIDEIVAPGTPVTPATEDAKIAITVLVEAVPSTAIAIPVEAKTAEPRKRKANSNPTPTPKMEVTAEAAPQLSLW